MGEAQRVVELMLAARSRADLLALGEYPIGPPVEMAEGFLERSSAISAYWIEHQALEVQPLEGSDESCYGSSRAAR